MPIHTKRTVCPPIPRDLLEYLQRVFPDKLPETTPSESLMGHLIGQQSVVRHLKAHFDQQNPAVSSAQQ